MTDHPATMLVAGSPAVPALRTPDAAFVLPALKLNPVLDARAPRTGVPLLIGIAILLVFVVGFGTWATLAPLAEAAIAPGVVQAEGNRRTIQHLEGGIVRDILVRDGDKVAAGQVLVRLNDIQASATLQTQQAARWALLAQDARLGAEAARARHIAFPTDLMASTDPRAIDAVTGQQALFVARTASLDSQTQALQARIEQQQAIIAGSRGQLTAAKRQLALSRREVEMHQRLMAQGLTRLPEMLAAQRNVANLEGTVDDLTGQIDRAQATIAETREQIRQAIDKQVEDALTDRRDVRRKLAETEQQLRAARDVQARDEIVAPESGTIVNLRVFTIGAVVKPGDAVMDLEPDHDRLVAEVHIQPTDIDVVHPGLRTEVQLPAFKQRLVPFLNGRVTWVAADVTTDDATRQQYYRAHVLIDREQLSRLHRVFLVPGMPVEAHILLGRRSLFRYLTQPIRDSLSRAFQEE